MNEEKRFKNVIASLLAIIGIVSGIIFSWLGYTYTLRSAKEQKIKEIVNAFSSNSEWRPQEKAYAHLKLLDSDMGLSKNNNGFQRIIAEHLFIAILGTPYPDRDIPKNADALRRIEVIDIIIVGYKSPEVIFAGILFIEENEKAIIELRSFVEKYPNSWLVPWAYFNLGSIFYRENKTIDAEESIEKLRKKADEFWYNASDITNMLNLVEGKKS